MAAGTLAYRKVAGHTFKCSNRTYWHLLWTIFVLRMRYPKARLQILQTCYHTGVDLSKGTHDYDAVLDVKIVGGVLGADWWKAQKFFRAHGWAAWFRHTKPWDTPSEYHIHMISLPPGLPALPDAVDVGRAYKALGITVGEFIDGGYTTNNGRITGTSQVVDYCTLHAEGLAGQHDQNDDPSWHPKDFRTTVFRRALWFHRVIR